MWPRSKNGPFSAIWPILRIAEERKTTADSDEVAGSGSQPTVNVGEPHHRKRGVVDDRVTRGSQKNR
jgi:hypothetical protein